MPLPAFEKGGFVGEHNGIITSEAGYEYAVKPNGGLVKTGSNGAEVRTDIPKGSFVIPHHISKQLDKHGFGNTGDINADSATALYKVMLESKRQDTLLLAKAMASIGALVSESIQDAIRGIPQPNIQLTDKKLKTFIKKRHSKTSRWSKINKY